MRRVGEANASKVMGFLGRMLRFLFWVLVVSWALKLLGRAIRGVGNQGSAPPDADPRSVGGGKRLVRDPICGMHMAEELALPLRTNGEVLHFCSEECRAKYERSMMKRAANG